MRTQPDRRRALTVGKTITLPLSVQHKQAHAQPARPIGIPILAQMQWRTALHAQREQRPWGRTIAKTARQASIKIKLGQASAKIALWGHTKPIQSRPTARAARRAKKAPAPGGGRRRAQPVQSARQESTKDRQGWLHALYANRANSSRAPGLQRVQIAPPGDPRPVHRARRPRIASAQQGTTRTRRQIRVRNAWRASTKTKFPMQSQPANLASPSSLAQGNQFTSRRQARRPRPRVFPRQPFGKSNLP